MAAAVEQAITVTVRGTIDERDRERALERVGRVCAHVREPVLFAEVKLTHEPDPARERPYVAEAVLTLSGSTLRAHVAAETMAASIDLLHDRLRRRTDRYLSIRADRRTDHATLPVDGERVWGHGDLATHRPERVVRPTEERELVRHKSFAVGEMTADEAADVLDLLGHDFLLFTNVRTGADAVIRHDAERGFELMDASGRDDAAGEDTVAPVQVRNTAVRHCALTEAIEELDLDLEPFVFFVDPESERGHVAYRRYDGHHGLITPA